MKRTRPDLKAASSVSNFGHGSWVYPPIPRNPYLYPKTRDKHFRPRPECYLFLVSAGRSQSRTEPTGAGAGLSRRSRTEPSGAGIGLNWPEPEPAGAAAGQSQSWTEPAGAGADRSRSLTEPAGAGTRAGPSQPEAEPELAAESQQAGRLA